jgi:hypothetical protein
MIRNWIAKRRAERAKREAYKRNLDMCWLEAVAMGARIYKK